MHETQYHGNRQLQLSIHVMYCIDKNSNDLFTATSRNDCNLHLTSSVGHSVNDEKNDAITPANALLRMAGREREKDDRKEYPISLVSSVQVAYIFPLI